MKKKRTQEQRAEQGKENEKYIGSCDCKKEVFEKSIVHISMLVKWLLELITKGKSFRVEIDYDPEAPMTEISAYEKSANLDK